MEFRSARFCYGVWIHRANALSHRCHEYIDIMASPPIQHTDSDFAGFVDSQKSTTGYCFKFGNGAISWKLKLQECTTTSMTEGEYVAASEASK